MNKIKLPRWLFEGMQKKKCSQMGLIGCPIFCSKGHLGISILESNRYKKIVSYVDNTICGIPWRHKPTVCLTKLCRHTLRFLNMHFRHKNQGWLKKTVKNWCWKKKLMVIIVLLKNHLKWDFLKTQHEIGTSVKKFREIVYKKMA